MNLYNKHRPPKIKDFLGNEETVEYFKGIFSGEEELPQAILLHGDTGCGKTTLARIVAKKFKIDALDIMEIDSANFRGIDTVRDIGKKIKFQPINSDARMWIIDEVQKMTSDAQNAFLKILEEPVKNRFFMLCTTDPQKLIAPLQGRCIKLKVNPLSDSQMIELLSTIAKKEGFKVPTEVLEQICIDSFGRPRNGIQLLQTIKNLPKKRMLKAVTYSAAQLSESIELCRALMNPRGNWKKVANILKSLKEQNQDPESIRRHVISYCESTLLKGGNPKIMNTAANILSEFSEPLYDAGFPGLVLYSYSSIME